ncbi:MAG: hypothetical protein KKD44_26165 [Proteobacteria bacterium]|nr:hypothetical protein [Patescibacteria group bacterium]MBU1173063.1 hypothetical protein [Pseudomonadota bacterium]
MKKDNTLLLVIAGLAAGYLLMPEKVKDAVTGGGTSQGLNLDIGFPEIQMPNIDLSGLGFGSGLLDIKGNLNDFMRTAQGLNQGVIKTVEIMLDEAGQGLDFNLFNREGQTPPGDQPQSILNQSYPEMVRYILREGSNLATGWPIAQPTVKTLNILDIGPQKYAEMQNYSGVLWTGALGPWQTPPGEGWTAPWSKEWASSEGLNMQTESPLSFQYHSNLPRFNRNYENDLATREAESGLSPETPSQQVTWPYKLKATPEDIKYFYAEAYTEHE